MNYLVDTNAFIALLSRDHIHFERVHAFFKRRPFAVCPMVQLGALRFFTRPRVLEGKVFPPICQPDCALNLVRFLTNSRGKTFFADDINCAGLVAPFAKVAGHAQWTDAYLVGIAASHKTRLATCDTGVVESHPDFTRLIPDLP